MFYFFYLVQRYDFFSIPPNIFVLKNVKIKKIFSWKNLGYFFNNFYEIIFQKKIDPFHSRYSAFTKATQQNSLLQHCK